MKSIPEFRISKPGTYELILFYPRKDAGEKIRGRHEVPNLGTRDCAELNCTLCDAGFEKNQIYYGEVDDSEEQLRKLILSPDLVRTLNSEQLLCENGSENENPNNAHKWISILVTLNNGDYQVKKSPSSPSQRTLQAWQQALLLNADLIPLDTKDLPHLSTETRVLLARHSRNYAIMDALISDESPRVRATCIYNRSLSDQASAMKDRDPKSSCRLCFGDLIA